MSEERKRILDMLASGKITAQEADELLSTLEGDKEKLANRKEARFLRVRVWSKDGKEKVNVNVPLSLAKIAMKFIPKDARTQLNDKEIDLDAIIREIQDGASCGKIVEVEEENERVEIYLD